MTDTQPAPNYTNGLYQVTKCSMQIAQDRAVSRRLAPWEPHAAAIMEAGGKTKSNNFTLQHRG